MLSIEPNISYYKCHHKSSDNLDKWVKMGYSMLLTSANSLALQPHNHPSGGGGSDAQRDPGSDVL